MTQSAAIVTNEAAIKAHKRQLRKASAPTAIASALAAAMQPAPAPDNAITMILVRPTGDAFIPSVKKDGSVISPDKLSKVGTLEREIPMLSHEQAVTLLKQNDRASLSVTAACATLIADWLISTPHAVSASADGKAWKLIKSACEAHLIGESRADDEGFAFTFPQVWENYFSSCKKYLSLGGSPSSLIYRNALDADCVRSVRWIKGECSRLDTTPAAAKSERMETSIINMVESAFGGKEGKGEVVSPSDIHLPRLEAQFLLDVAEANLGTVACRERLNTEDAEQILRRLIATHGAVMIKAMVDDLVA